MFHVKHNYIKLYTVPCETHYKVMKLSTFILLQLLLGITSYFYINVWIGNSRVVAKSASNQSQAAHDPHNQNAAAVLMTKD